MTRNAPADGNKKNVEIKIPLKYLSNLKNSWNVIN